MEDAVEGNPSYVNSFSEGLFLENVSLGIACLENFFLVTAFLASVSSENVLLENFSRVNVSLRNVLGRAF